MKYSFALIGRVDAADGEQCYGCQMILPAPNAAVVVNSIFSLATRAAEPA